MTAAEIAFRENERLLWGLGYRMTGSAQDADDIVQETFVRATTHPPEGEWRPWLVRIAVNLGRDRLRERKARAYRGPWLPEPVVVAPEGEAPDARYGMLESVTFAFLLALEALTPKQRAVLILRDVLDFSVKETAGALSLSEADVRTTHHRARSAMDGYDAARCIPTPERRERTREALTRFLAALGSGDGAALANLLAEDVRAVGDGGGKARAALHPLVGIAKVARFFLGLAAKETSPPNVRPVEVNGMPAFLVERTGTIPKNDARRFLVRGDVDESGRLVALHNVLNADKLARL